MRVCPHAEAADHFALGAVLQFSTDMGFHQEPPELPALYSETSAAKLAGGCPRGDWFKQTSPSVKKGETDSNTRDCAVAAGL